MAVLQGLALVAPVRRRRRGHVSTTTTRALSPSVARTLTASIGGLTSVSTCHAPTAICRG
jgi:hypothetical protein